MFLLLIPSILWRPSYVHAYLSSVVHVLHAYLMLVSSLRYGPSKRASLHAHYSPTLTFAEHLSSFLHLNSISLSDSILPWSKHFCYLSDSLSSHLRLDLPVPMTPILATLFFILHFDRASSNLAMVAWIRVSVAVVRMMSTIKSIIMWP